MFTKSFLTAAAACSLLVSSVNAHMVIRQPVPYGQSSLTNSPLEADGSDFPCKQRSGVYDITTMNDMPVGVPQNLAFTGGATHGGGSCQVSVTMDKEPTKSSKWKVIHSIIGGCPSNATENLSSNAAGENAAVFQFSVPKGMPNGQYTMAWTWFNKIGNREMYMNCAPITVTGGADNNDVLDTLPDMFVANIGNGCGTKEGQDFVFPNCGAYAETVMQTALGSATTGNCAAATGGSDSGSGSSPASSSAAPTGYAPSSAAASAPSKASSAAAAAPTVPTYGGSSAAAQAPKPTGYSGASSAEGGAAAGGVATSFDVTTATEMRTITMDGPAPSSYASPAESASSGIDSLSDFGTRKGSTTSSSSDTTTDNSTSSGSCPSGSVGCATDGAVVCLDSGKWGLCDRGCVFPMALSDGTSCAAGVITKRHSMAAHVRRHAKLHGHRL